MDSKEEQEEVWGRGEHEEVWGRGEQEEVWGRGEQEEVDSRGVQEAEESRRRCGQRKVRFRGERRNDMNELVVRRASRNS